MFMDVFCCVSSMKISVYGNRNIYLNNNILDLSLRAIYVIFLIL